MLLRICLIIAILAGIGTIVFTQMQARKQALAVIEERNDHIKKENEERSGRKKAENTLVNTSNQLVQTKGTLSKTEEDLNNAKQQLSTAQANVQKLDGDLKSAIATRREAEQKLEKWTQTGMNPEQVIAMRDDLKKAQDAIAALEDEKKILARQVQEWKNKYLTLMNPDEYSPELPAGTKGAIVAVDPKWNFVVLNIGRNKGLLERGVLLVHRGSRYIGKVRISEVLDNRAIANVMPGTALAEIEENDQVLY